MSCKWICSFSFCLCSVMYFKALLNLPASFCTQQQDPMANLHAQIFHVWDHGADSCCCHFTSRSVLLCVAFSSVFPSFVWICLSVCWLLLFFRCFVTQKPFFLFSLFFLSHLYQFFLPFFLCVLACLSALVFCFLCDCMMFFKMN